MAPNGGELPPEADCEILGRGPVLRIRVEAEDEDATRYALNVKMSAHQPLSELAAKWAQNFGIPDATVVGLQEAEGEELLAHTATPEALGWAASPSSATRRVWAFPLDEQYADPRTSAVAMKGRKQAMTSKPPTQAARGPTVTAAPAGPVDAAAAAPGQSEAPSVAAAAAVALLVAPLLPAAAEPAEGPPATAARKAGKTKPGPAPAVTPEPTAPEAKRARVGDKASSASRAVSGSASGSGSGGGGGARSAAAASGCPTGDDPCAFVQPSPKRAGTLSGDRYAKYMVAKTVNEALRLGAIRGDIDHDFKKGYLKRR